MTRFVTPRRAALVGSGLLTAATLPAAAELTVTSLDPPARTVTAATGAPISVTFDAPLNQGTVTTATFWAFGRWSGPVPGTITISADLRTATLTPTRHLSAGEQVMVILSRDIASTNGETLRAGGYSYQFWTRAGRGGGALTEIATFSTRTSPGESSRAYGGLATDLDQDGALDITIVNEDTSDLRVFLNQGDGAFAPFLQPTSATMAIPSPSEPGDFDRDGAPDVAVANTGSAAVSVLLGLGNGRFEPQQVYAVGPNPRGIAVLDIDGDGDMDIANTNNASSSLSLLFNDGDGTFTGPTNITTSGAGEWALAAVDMNEDGLLDLVTGTRITNEMIVLLNDGDGTFTESDAVSSSSIWMVSCGDLNGDGHEDITAVNSSANTGSVFFGDGEGHLSAPVSLPTDVFPLATDLGDFDGDGDLDWVTSSFAGDWFIFENDGAGHFSFDEEFLAPTAASCALAMDIDGDRDLDLALIDELADVVIVMARPGAPCSGDVDGSGEVGFDDVVLLLSRWGRCRTCAEDLDQDGEVAFEDLLLILSGWGLC